MLQLYKNIFLQSEVKIDITSFRCVFSRSNGFEMHDSFGGKASQTLLHYAASVEECLGATSILDFFNTLSTKTNNRITIYTDSENYQVILSLWYSQIFEGMTQPQLTDFVLKALTKLLLDRRVAYQPNPDFIKVHPKIDGCLLFDQLPLEVQLWRCCHGLCDYQVLEPVFKTAMSNYFRGQLRDCRKAYLRNPSAFKLGLFHFLKDSKFWPNQTFAIEALNDSELQQMSAMLDYVWKNIFKLSYDHADFKRLEYIEFLRSATLKSEHIHYVLRLELSDLSNSTLFECLNDKAFNYLFLEDISLIYHEKSHSNKTRGGRELLQGRPLEVS